MTLQWLKPMTLALYHLLDRELCHSTSKPIGEEEDTLKSFMAFDIIPRGLIFRVAVESQIVVPPKITSKNFWNVFGVFLLYLVVLDWNSKCFCGLWAQLKFGKLQFLIDWAFLLIVQALQKLTFSFYSLHVLDLNLYNLEQCLKLNLDIFFILVCQCT